MSKIAAVIHRSDNTMSVILDSGEKFNSRGESNILDLLAEVYMATPDIDNVSWKDLCDRGYKGQILSNSDFMTMAKLGVDAENNVITVTVTDGDNGDALIGSGETVIQAVAKILRSEKYEPGQSGCNSPTEFMQAIAYGRERRSNELLQAELEQVFAPEKGAW